MLESINRFMSIWCRIYPHLLYETLSKVLEEIEIKNGSSVNPRSSNDPFILCNVIINLAHYTSMF